MSFNISLPFWPTILDNVKWSSDNIIAIAGGEVIAILVPKLKTTSDELQWSQLVLKINTFNEDQQSLVQSLSFANWSTGEELSARHVQSLDWSGPGLGSFGSCVLTILHSDHTLDLWSYDGRPDIKESWSKCLLPTNAVRAYYQRQKNTNAFAESAQVCARIRSFAWQPHSHNTRSAKQSQNTEQMLAVATEAGDILILRITSPCNILSNEHQDWNAEVVQKLMYNHYISSPDPLARPAGYSDFYLRDRIIEHLLWLASPVKERLILAFVADESLYWLQERCAWIDPADQNVETQVSVEGLVIGDVHGPIRSVPGEDIVLCFQNDDLLAVRAASANPADATLQSHHVDRTWSEMSGLLVLRATDGTLALPATHLAYEKLQQPCMRIGTDQSTYSEELSRSQQALQSALKVYNRKNPPTDEGCTRTWGIAATLSYSHVAICCNILPAGSPSHIIAAHQRSHLLIAAQSQYEQDTLRLVETVFKYDGLPVETTLYALQSYTIAQKTSPEDDFQPEPVQDFSRILRLQVERDASTDDSCIVSLDPDIVSVIQQLRLQLLSHPSRLDDVCQRLHALVLGEPCSSFLPIDWYMALSNTVNELASTCAHGGQLSADILDMYKRVANRLSHLDPALEHDLADSTEEKCHLCHNVLPFEALKWARCSVGHRFTRCSLTFLAIPRPGMSKSCGVCGAQYINEQEWPAFRIEAIGETPDGDSQESQQLAAVEPESSIARTLFAMFNKCILCNGRFLS